MSTLSGRVVMQASKPGQILLEKYRIERGLGVGGMGIQKQLEKELKK